MSEPVPFTFTPALCLKKGVITSRNNDGTVNIEYNGVTYRAESIVIYTMLEPEINVVRVTPEELQRDVEENENQCKPELS